MTENKKTVERYMEAFRAGDREAVLACLNDGVVWELPGVYHLIGKDAFEKEIQNEAFVGLPTIEVTRLVEEEDVVVAEGTVRAAKREGGVLNAVFCDVFTMRHGKIDRLVSYLMELRSNWFVALLAGFLLFARGASS